MRYVGEMDLEEIIEARWERLQKEKSEYIPLEEAWWTFEFSPSPLDAPALDLYYPFFSNDLASSPAALLPSISSRSPLFSISNSHLSRKASSSTFPGDGPLRSAMSFPKKDKSHVFPFIFVFKLPLQLLASTE
ncbi:MAG: hypothetical protein JW999_09200 [Methanotrichaceae archaeon]|nr:hypothetical protein [Methanotrichaceae archaeon]